MSVAAHDGRLETLAAALSRAAGRPIVVAATQAASPAPIGSAAFTGATWQQVLLAVCDHADLGVEPLEGGTLLLTRGPLGSGARPAAIVARAGLSVLHGPGAPQPGHRGDAASVRAWRHGVAHWWRTLGKATPGQHVRARGRLVAIDAAPFDWGRPLFDLEALSPPGPSDEPRVVVRARREHVLDVVARLARRVDRRVVVHDVDPRRLLSCDLPPLPWRDALWAIARPFGLEVRARSDGSVALQRPGQLPYLAARAVPLQAWLELLSRALDDPARFEGPLAGSVEADLVGVDPADARAATLALWRCEASRGPDGVLVVRQPQPVSDPLGPPAPSPRLLAQVESALAIARRGPGEEQLQALCAAVRELVAQASPEDAALARASVAPDEEALDAVLLALFDGEAMAITSELERARRCRDLPRAHRALVRLRQLAEVAPPRPDFGHLPFDVPAEAHDWSELLREEALDWDLCPVAGVVEDEPARRRAIVGGRIVAEGDVVETAAGPARILEISPAGVLYERGEEQDLVPYP